MYSVARVEENKIWVHDSQDNSVSWITGRRLVKIVVNESTRIYGVSDPIWLGSKYFYLAIGGSYYGDNIAYVCNDGRLVKNIETVKKDAWEHLLDREKIVSVANCNYIEQLLSLFPNGVDSLLCLYLKGIMVNHISCDSNVIWIVLRNRYGLIRDKDLKDDFKNILAKELSESTLFEASYKIFAHNLYNELGLRDKWLNSQTRVLMRGEPESRFRELLWKNQDWIDVKPKIVNDTILLAKFIGNNEG